MRTCELNLKNGKIEFLRFVFAICVLFYHTGKYILGKESLSHGVHFAFFPKGNMGVEFFFILSGLLMAKSIYKKVNNSDTQLENNCLDVGIRSTNEYLQFILSKVKAILPYHVLTFLFTFIVYAAFYVQGTRDFIELALNNIPSFLLINMSGINLGNVNGLTWYLSCMLISMLILYPICRKYYYQFTHYFAPLAALLILGGMSYNTGSLSGVEDWYFVAYKSMLRAIAEISIGTTAFEVSRVLMNNSLFNSRKLKTMSTIIEILCFVISMFFIVLTLRNVYQVYIIGIFFILISISFSGISYGSRIFNNKVCYHLGKISLPIYLSQRFSWYIVDNCFTNYSEYEQMAAMIIITIMLAYFVFLLVKLLDKIRKKGKI